MLYKETMEFKHPFIATGIGSFPHLDEKEVFRLIVENFPEIPFWPQLPRRSFLEGMILQYSQGFPSLKWDEGGKRVWISTSEGFEEEVEKFYGYQETGELEPFRMTEEFTNGFGILESITPQDRQKIKYIKGQITGPVTFGLSLIDDQQRTVFYDPTLRDIAVKHLASKARWMEKRFHELFPGVETILSFDEPSLSSFGSAFSGLNREDVISSLNECLDAVGGLKAVHCCGNTDWSVLLATHLDILSFDAFEYFEALSLYPKDLKAFLERGGILAWGIVPTNEEVAKEDGHGLTERIKKEIVSLSKKGIDPSLLQRAIITPSCGTASLPIPLSEKVCRLTAEVSKRLRENPPF
jgi:methionine synthase II (cobalamin-independent)